MLPIGRVFLKYVNCVGHHDREDLCVEDGIGTLNQIVLKQHIIYFAYICFVFL